MKTRVMVTQWERDREELLKTYLIVMDRDSSVLFLSCESEFGLQLHTHTHIHSLCWSAKQCPCAFMYLFVWSLCKGQVCGGSVSL